MPNFLIIIISIMVSSVTFASNLHPLKKLKDLEWKNRIILVWTDNQSAINKALSDQSSEIDERHIVWFIFSEQTVASNYKGSIDPSFLFSVSRRFSNPEETVLLVGKDGGVKDRSSTLDLEFLFGEIDQMPMRKIEMMRKTEP